MLAFRDNSQIVLVVILLSVIKLVTSLKPGLHHPSDNRKIIIDSIIFQITI